MGSKDDPIVDGLNAEWPEIDHFDPQEWKLLFKLLCENDGKLKLEQGLTDYGKQVLHSVQNKIGILVVGVGMYRG